MEIVGITKSVPAGLGPAAARAEHIKTKYCLGQTQAGGEGGGGEPAATRAGVSKLTRMWTLKPSSAEKMLQKGLK